MIVTDFNKMSLEELTVINKFMGFEFELNDGEIVGTALQNGTQGD